MPLSIQGILIERLLSAGRCSKGWNTAGNQTDRNCPGGLTLVRGICQNRLRDGDRRSQDHRGTNRREGATERGSETARDTERTRKRQRNMQSDRDREKLRECEKH